ncbi:MAG: alpha/beta hydrolase [Clostridia bacterium]|nr:alpha/beta hydrolase [Clostridia bacterium]
MSKRKRYIKACEVSELAEVSLGGYPQKILIEGYKKDLPVVIFLHGGPGSPVPFSVGCRGLFPEWSQKAVMVFWDQLGCGINNFKIGESFTAESFTEMTCSLINYVKERFPQNKIYLFGVSWGSVLALRAAVRMQEKLDGVFVYGQVLKNLFFNEEVASAFASAPISAQTAVQKILADGAGCEYAILNKNLKALNKLLRKHTNAYFNKNARPVPVGKIIMGMLTSPDYSFKDFKAVAKNGYRFNQSLWRELLNIDLTPLLSEVKIKYLLIQGDTDIVTSTETAVRAVENCNNPNVTVKTVKNSGHMPSAEAMEECFKALLQFVG